MKPPALPQLPPRDPQSHKGDFGRVLMIGGSRGMAGSISLTASAALKSGVGLVSVAVPNGCLETVAGFDRCYMTIGLPEDPTGSFFELAQSRLAKHTEPFTAFGCGPGMRTGLGASRVVRHLCSMDDSKPCVFDADALNCLALIEEWQELIGPTHVLTPHPGEWQRLCGIDASNREEQTEKAASISSATGATIVLKGKDTFISSATNQVISSTGNPGMATGGSGDILTGVITALLAQGLPPADAAHLGVHVHGIAGDHAAEAKGQIGMTAEGILEHLPTAFMTLGT